MAEIGFEKRDFRMVSYSLVTVLCNSFVSSHSESCLGAETVSVLFVFLGCLLHGPCFGVGLSLPQVQDTEGRVLSPAGTLP